jgi:transposase
LASVVGKTWGPVGQKTIIKTTGNRGGVSAISAITKSGGLIFNLYDDKITSEEIIEFLHQMLNHHPRRHLVVVMDQARPHVSKMTKSFIDSKTRLHVYYLPPRSPEYNPDEKVWNHLKNEDLKSHQAKNVKELKKLTRSKLAKLSNSPSMLRGIFNRCEIAKLL